MMTEIKEEIKSRDKIIGNKIRSYRRILNFSQAEIARSLGISQQQMQKYEKGQNKISASRIEILSEVMGVPTCIFFKKV